MSKLPFKAISERSDLGGKYVLVRTSMNVPIVDGEVGNQFRITRGLATLQYLVQQKARVIVCGHIGSDGSQSVAPVAELLGQYLQVQVSEEVTGTKTQILRERLQDGEVLVLENLRKDPREKKNDPEFARELASLAEIYVNDAFPVGHRAHASVVGVPEHIPSYAGMNFVHEYQELTKASSPDSPALFLLGGAKFDTKMPLVEKFLDIYDNIFIGGALANDFFKAVGYEVGQSLVSDIDLSESPLLTNEKLRLPIDVTVRSGEEQRVCAPDAVEPHETILDVGPQTIAMLTPLIANAKMVLWNGPFGNYEEGFEEQTIATAKVIAEADGYSLVGGGDTVAAIESLCIQEKYNFLSTAGGAMLTYLEEGTLPAIEALEKNGGVS